MKCNGYTVIQESDVTYSRKVRNGLAILGLSLVVLKSPLVFYKR
jgi:hypothetical protein